MNVEVTLILKVDVDGVVDGDGVLTTNVVPSSMGRGGRTRERSTFTLNANGSGVRRLSNSRYSRSCHPRHHWRKQRPYNTPVPISHHPTPGRWAFYSFSRLMIHPLSPQHSCKSIHHLSIAFDRFTAVNSISIMFTDLSGFIGLPVRFDAIRTDSSTRTRLYADVTHDEEYDSV